ncbi:MAG: hypothetical protein LBO66_13165 [Deltaproteobacteria bacterium]|nr:hypothetical protein [Deltaproteobacteria bacterium]
MADEKATLREGIYLQTKKSTIGTGSTAKHAEYRNFWATLKIGDTHVEMVLLDDSFLLTGIREKFAVEELEGSNWLFVEQGEKKYGQLKPKLCNILNPAAKGGACAVAKPAAPGSARKSAANPSKKNGWWNK